jgi:MFS family permease
MLSGFAVRQSHRPGLLPPRVVLDRNRGMALIALVVNALSTFGMMLILTYQMQWVMHYQALSTGLALIPFAVAAAIGSAFLAPALMTRIRPRWLLSGAVVAEAAGLVPLAWLTPASSYWPLIALATIIEGLGTGLAGPVTLNAALSGVLPPDRGAAGAVTSAVGQLGSSIGAAVLNTIAVASAAGYLAAHAAAGRPVAVVHGFTVAMVWGAAILIVAAVPIALFVNASAAARIAGR